MVVAEVGTPGFFTASLTAFFYPPVPIPSLRTGAPYCNAFAARVHPVLVYTVVTQGLVQKELDFSFDRR